MLRIDVDSAPDQGKGYHVPQDNPFIGQAVWPEIYAYGFRNPWACSWDSNRLICGDVGQDLVEEIKCVLFGASSAHALTRPPQHRQAWSGLRLGELGGPRADQGQRRQHHAHRYVALASRH